MKSFMSSALQETQKPVPASECGSCNNAVRTSGQESIGAVAPETTAKPDATPPTPQKEEAVVVMQGALGSVITEALNKTHAKKAMAGAVQIPSASMESRGEGDDNIQANGMIHLPSNYVSRLNKSVGLVPKVDETPTVVNTLLDAASKVDDIEFVMVGVVDSNPNPAHVPQKRIMHLIGVDGVPGVESIAIESIQVIVNYRKLPQ